MQLTTNKGKTFEINYIWPTTRNGEKLMIELEDSRTASQIVADFDGVEVFEKTEKKKPGKEVFEGFTRLVGYSSENFDGVIRLTLEKGDAA